MCVCTCMLCHSLYISSDTRFRLGGLLVEFLGRLDATFLFYIHFANVVEGRENYLNSFYE